VILQRISISLTGPCIGRWVLITWHRSVYVTNEGTLKAMSYKLDIDTDLVGDVT